MFQELPGPQVDKLDDYSLLHDPEHAAHEASRAVIGTRLHLDEVFGAMIRMSVRRRVAR